MANAKSTYMMARKATNYRFLTSDPIQFQPPNTEFELDESDVWGGSTWSDSPESRPPPPSSRHMRRENRSRCSGGGPKSLPVNVPDWSKILKEEYNDKFAGRERIGGDDGGDDGGDERMPPHEYLARTRMASLSVHEGIGRTLKGRDLSRVRNAIWQKTGFQD